MARVTPLTGEPQDPNVAEIFQEIQGAFGMVPNLFRTYANFPPLLRANWEKVKAVMMSGTLRQEVKQTIAVLVSKDNSCKYCVAAHTTALMSLGITADQVTELESNLNAADFNPKEQTLINFAREANRNANEVNDKQFRALRDSGAKDAEIVEALGVMEVFTAFNKFLDSLHVDIDF